MNRHLEVASLLIDLEAVLRTLRLWSKEIPDEESLTSSMPFAADKLTFTQWLQFIFIPKMYQLIDEQMQLPEHSSIGEMAELYFSGQSQTGKPVIEILEAIDNVLNCVDAE